MNSLGEYLDFKFIQMIMVSEDINDELKECEKVIFKDTFVLSLQKFIDTFVVSNTLEKTFLNNLIELISYIKENSGLPKQEYNSIYNDMKSKINVSDCSNTVEYFIDNYFFRFYGHGIIKNICNKEKYLNMRYMLKDIVSKDYNYLVYLVASTEEYFMDVLPDLMIDETFLLSINQIVHEYPAIVNDVNFLKRLRMVVEANLQLSEVIQDPKRKKVILKRSKYYYNQIKI